MLDVKHGSHLFIQNLIVSSQKSNWQTCVIWNVGVRTTFGFSLCVISLLVILVTYFGRVLDAVCTWGWKSMELAQTCTECRNSCNELSDVDLSERPWCYETLWTLTVFIFFYFSDFILILFFFSFSFSFGRWRGTWCYSHMTCHMMWHHRPRTW